jgi:hypothetical protein
MTGPRLVSLAYRVAAYGGVMQLRLQETGSDRKEVSLDDPVLADLIER